MTSKKEKLIAIRESIQHWLLDIRRPLLKRKKIVPNNWGSPSFSLLKWEGTADLVKVGGIYCSLCKQSKLCKECALYVATKQECALPDSPYQLFMAYQDIPAADAMISALVFTYWYTAQNMKMMISCRRPKNITI